MEYFDYDRESHSFLDQANSWDIDVSEFLERSQEKQRQRLQKELDQIAEELEKRDRLHEELVEELASKLNLYADRLDRLYGQWFAGRPEKRERLKNRIEEFYEQIRREKRSHWRDRQELEQERRELLRELDELDEDLISELL